MSAPAPRPPPSAGSGMPLGRRAAGPLLWLLLAFPGVLFSGGGGPDAAAATGAPGAGQSAKQAFDRVVRGWRAGSATAVVSAMHHNRMTRFTLLCYPLSGKTCNMRPKQARVSLKTYFLRIKGIRLKDVTPRTSPASVRLYEFTYTPEREDVRTTRLHIQLARDRKGPWVLTSVTESAKPRD